MMTLPMMRTALALTTLLIAAFLAATPCFAASSRPFVLAVVTDGTAVGTLSGTLEVSVSDSVIAWTLSSVKFHPGPIPDGTVACNADALNGTGTTPLSARAAVKDFCIVVTRDSGVDISYRFRLSAEMEGETLTGVVIEKQA